MISALDLPTSLAMDSGDLILRRAVRDDLPALMELLSDDPVSAGRGDRADPDDAPVYELALAELISDASNELLLVVDAANRVVATMQLTRIPGLARRGSTRLQVEAVRVDHAYRSAGIGSAMMGWVIRTAAPSTGAALVQLTSDERRLDAHRFYERLGFVATHRGFKLEIGPRSPTPPASR